MQVAIVGYFTEEGAEFKTLEEADRADDVLEILGQQLENLGLWIPPHERERKGPSAWAVWVAAGRAGGGEDNVKGGGGSDVIFGGGGADRLNGGGGADTLRGNGGDDTLKGNGGADVFQFRTSDRNDTILDFRQGQDKIEIQNGARTFAALSIDQDGGDVLIGFGAGQVRVMTDNVRAFDESDFIF